MTWYTAAHCGRFGCMCTHDSGCFKGWVDVPDRIHHGVSYAQAAPCPICRPVSAGRLAREDMRTSRDIP